MEIVPSEPWSCKEIIFSDIGRDTAIVWQGNMILDQLDLYHPWKRIVVDFEWLRKLAESNVSFIISGHYMMGPRSADAMLEEVKSLAWASRILNSSSDPDMVDCMIEEFYTDSVTSASKIWLYHPKNSPSCTILFIPKPRDRTTPPISSSEI